MANVIPDDWAGRYARVVAREVRRYREERGMSAQQLSDACAALGLPIHRSVLANFENGRRSNLNLNELLVIARALGVAPIFLMFPLGYEETVEVLPGMTVPTAEAVEWAAGDDGRRWLAAEADLGAATLWQLRQFEGITLQELEQGLKLGLHLEGGCEAIFDEFAEASRRNHLVEGEQQKLKAEVELLEQATQQASAPSLLSARRRLADFEATRERRSAEFFQIGERYLAAQQWQRSGGLQALAQRLVRIQEEITKRGMKPTISWTELFEAFEGGES
jgi:transcriptional regulator with XRE-family HTH domain